MSHFDEIGGEPVLRAIIDDFVERVFGDTMIGFLFARASKNAWQSVVPFVAGVLVDRFVRAIENQLAAERRGKSTSLDRVLAIGDVHGCSRAFEALLAEARVGDDDLLVTLGDYVDRGLDARADATAIRNACSASWNPIRPRPTGRCRRLERRASGMV